MVSRSSSSLGHLVPALFESRRTCGRYPSGVTRKAGLDTRRSAAAHGRLASAHKRLAFVVEPQVMTAPTPHIDRKRPRRTRAGLDAIARSVINRSAAVLAAAVVLLVVGCGGNQDGASEPGPQHVHALSQAPGDQALYIATHTGMFRLSAAASSADRVGDSYQDTMGFTIVSSERFIGSGHPDLPDDLPPLLGLIESRDQGRSWRSVSLLGKADFHILRAAPGRIYGYDATGGRLLVSQDEGRTWNDRRLPGELVDFVVDPADADRLLAATETTLYVSGDGGRTLRALPARRSGLMAWPRREVLLLVDRRGDVLRSGDGARSWTRIGNVRGVPAALTATDERRLFLAVHDGPLLGSVDGGSTWNTRLTLDGDG